MASPRSFDDKLARLREIADDAPPEAHLELAKYIADKNGYLAGEAATVAKKHDLSSLVPRLCEAFMRLLVDPVKVDKGCFGKNRILEALLAFDAHEPDVYLAGLRHIQREGAIPFVVDTAAPLRGLCARALFHIHHRGALLDVAPLLFDEEAAVRAEAAGALGDSGLEGAAAALHIKVLSGDSEPDVMGAAYRGLLRLYPERYLPLVTLALMSDVESHVEAAALALGEARAPGALEALQKAFREHRGSRASEAILLGVALLRSDAANDHLISLLEEGSENDAMQALAALALHRHDAALVHRVELLVARRRSRKLLEAFSQKLRS